MGSCPCNFIKRRRKNNHRIRMVNRRLLLVTFIVFCAFFEGTMALKCYSGEFDNQPGRRDREPRLHDCGSNDDLCLSYYAKTDFLNKWGREIYAGSWAKGCVGRSSSTIEELDGDYSERCIESKNNLLTIGTAIM